MTLEGIAHNRLRHQDYLFGSLAVIAVAGAFSASDASRLWCDPSRHVFQGHAIWHVLNGIGLPLAFLHYRQFRALYV